MTPPRSTLTPHRSPLRGHETLAPADDRLALRRISASTALTRCASVIANACRVLGPDELAEFDREVSRLTEPLVAGRPPPGPRRCPPWTARG